ncbi:sensor histidine kinase [Desulfurispira natronophila]|uniref:histidine kinase n=1 Tax=Desulfurispira natronophila TaxID=682562 RepID=A0A7W7Y3J1_9BACT|nr:HAMP domain-containing sensor histidine kinase [Desulfurispira natronophila]MBB5021162.1 signal transduction histidine kinase [Desulfurispira natronophila]
MAQDISQVEDHSIVNELERRLHEKTASIREMEQMTRRLLNLNEQIRHTETIKSEFISLIKNEFKTPITELLEASESIVDHGDMERITSTGQMLHRQLIYIDFHMKNIFAAAELEARESQNALARVGLAGIVDDVKNVLQYVISDKDLQIAIHSELANDQLITDAEKLFLIMMNLISNACEYSFQGSTIHIRAWDTPEEISIAVEDSGEGIPEEQMERIFQKFYQYDTGKTRMQKGLGLGLNVARGLAQLLGGTISCSSAQGESSTVFTLSLPRQDDQNVSDTSDGANDFMFESF